MRARNSCSIATSTSVTRSIAPFLSTRKLVPKRCIITSPARTTASTAVVRNRGLDIGGGVGCSGLRVGGAGGLHAFHHAHLHAAFRCALQDHFVHETANQEDAAAAALQQVLRRERVGDLLGIEAFALVADPDGEFPRGVEGAVEFDEHLLAGVVL